MAALVLRYSWILSAITNAQTGYSILFRPFLHPLVLSDAASFSRVNAANSTLYLLSLGRQVRAQMDSSGNEKQARRNQAELRVRTIKSKFQSRRMHPEVFKYCRTELMQDNYFHAVFEATKGLAQRIRDMSGIQADGAALIDPVFSESSPSSHSTHFVLIQRSRNIRDLLHC